MKPKEAAEYLVRKFDFIPINNGYSYADNLEIRKQCALICAIEAQGEYEIEHDAPKYLLWENIIKEIEAL
jgi:hypothetical protein